MTYANVQQVVAPSFDGVGTLLRGANESFNNAFSSANGILAQYQEGQQAKGDAMFLENIKGATDEKSLTDILGKMDFTKLNLTPEMQKVALGMRDTVLGYDTTRISNRNSIDMNARANAGENRTQTDWVYVNNARDALNAATPGFLNGYVGNLTTGRAAPAGGNWLRYENQGAVRNDPINDQLAGAMSFVGDMGIEMRVISGGQESNKPGEGTGSTRHNGGASADVDFYRDGRKLDWNNEADLPILQQIVSTAKSRGVTGIGAGDDYMGPGRFHVGFGNPAVWGAGGKGENASDWLKAAYNSAPAGGATPGPNGYTGGQQNGYMQSPSMLAGLDAIRKLAASGTLSPEAAKGLVDTLIGAQVAGQTSINDRDLADQALRAAAAQNQIALDPMIMNDTQRQAAMLTTPGLNPLTAQKGAGDLNTLTAPGGALGAIATPAVTADPTVQAAVEQQNAADQLALSVSGEARKNDLLTKFTSAEDPVAALVEQANETGGGSIFAGVDLDEDTRKAVQTLADAAGVSVPQMAATLADMTDPSTEQRGWGLNNRPSLEALLGSVQDGGLGALRQFFNDPTGNSPSGKDAIIARAKEDAALAAGYTGKSTANLKSAADREATQNRIQTTQSQIAKLQAINPSDPQIAILQKQLQDLKQGLFNNATPTQDAIARVKMYTPGSPDHAREVAALSAAIDADPGIKDKAGAKKALGITP